VKDPYSEAVSPSKAAVKGGGVQASKPDMKKK